jgi:hypothetical protein
MEIQLLDTRVKGITVQNTSFLTNLGKGITDVSTRLNVEYLDLTTTVRHQNPKKHGRHHEVRDGCKFALVPGREIT